MNAMSISNQGINTQRTITQPNVALVRDSLLAGIAGGVAAIVAGVVQAMFYAGDIWAPLKALGSLVLGPVALAQAGFIAGPVLAGLLASLVIAALLGALFGIITRYVWGLPSDFGVPALSGLVFGLLISLAASLATPVLIVPFMVYGTVAGLALAKLQPRPYAADK